MASAGAKIHKLILDIQDCIDEIKREFCTTSVPIDDDNSALHRLCEKLEHLLQAELKETFGLLGNLKTYWDYFCKCLASRRGIHDGLKFVKSVSEFKTAQGRGRAFIRYCLVHRCLADTFQECLQNGRITSDFYHAHSLLLQFEQTSCLIAALYELNEVQFDISSHGHDLDVSWPTFARKVFGALSQWRAPSRTVSLTSLTSIQSDLNHSVGYDNNGNGYRSNSHLPHIESSSVVDLLAKVDEIQQEQAETKDFARRTHEKMDQVVQSESWWQGQEEELRKKMSEVDFLAGEYAQKLEAVQIQQDDKESLIQENSRLKLTLKDLETSKSELELQIDSLKKQLLLKEETEQQLVDQKLVKSELEQRNATSPKLETTSSESGRGIFCVDSSTQVIETDMGVESSPEAHLLNDRDLILVEIESLREENEGFKLQTEKWKKCITMFSEKLAIKERVNSHLEKQVVALKDAVAALKEMMQVKMLESDSLRNLVQELKALRDVQFDVEHSDGNVQSLKNENVDLKEKMSNLNSNFENLKLDLDSKLKLLSDKETSLILTVAKTQELGLTLRQTENKVVQLKRQLETSFLENQTLNRRLDTMREMLKRVEKAEEELEKLEAVEGARGGSENNTNDENEDDGGATSSSQNHTVNFVLYDAPCLLTEDLPSMTLATRTVDRLQCLISEKQEMQAQLISSIEINSNLISKVQKQEEQLTTVTVELCETKALVEKMKVMHSKLQTSEAILRYELKEKRSVVEGMKEMLESTRAQWMRMRQQQTESELEYQSLRADFASRAKQESMESGFVEDSAMGKSDERESLIDDSDKQPESPSEMAALSSEGMDMDVPAIQATSPPTTSELEDLPEALPDEDDGRTDTAGAGRSRTSTRLRIMEEQCRLLYSKLVASVKKSEILDWKLSQLHKQHGGTEEDDNSSRDVSESGLKDVNANFDIIYVPYGGKVKKSGENTSESQGSIMDGEQQQDVVNSEEEAAESLSGDTESSAVEDGGMETTETHLIEGNDYEEQEPISPEIIDESKVEPLAMAQALPKRIELLRKKKEDLELNMRKMAKEKSESEAREADLHLQLDAMKLKILERDSQIDGLSTEKADLVKRETEFKKRADFILRKEREEKEARLQAVMKAKQELQIKLDSMQNQIEEKQGQVTKLEATLEETVDEFEKMKSSLQQEVKKLQGQLSTQTTKNELAVKSLAEHETYITKMLERIAEQEHHTSFLEEALQEIKQVRDQEIQQHRMEYEELQMCLSVREEECVSLNDDLKETIRQYDIEKMKSTEQTVIHNELTTENGKLRDELAVIKEDFNELTKRAIKLVREKDLLWKRSEHLSFIQKIQATDSWLKDDEVVNCMGCKAEFSFILRKHHCRRCGKVYCTNCCNHWVMSTASSRRVRVCTDCLLNHSPFSYEAIALGNDEEQDESFSGSPSESIPIPHGSREEGEFSGTSSSCTPDREILGSSPGASSGRQSPSTSSSTCTDEKSVKDRSLLGRLFKSWNHSPKSKEIIIDEDEEEFHIISDEEIMKSLSQSSPYAPLGAEYPDPSTVICPTCPLDEILKEFSSGLHREVFVNAGKSYGVPIFISKPVTFTWEFSTEPKSIAFSLAYHALPSDEYSDCSNAMEGKQRLIQPSQVLYPLTHCNSHLHTMLGKVIARRTGIYVFYFINGFSRFTAKKVKFILRLADTSQPQASSTEESEHDEQSQASSVEELEQGQQPQASKEEELEEGEQPQASREEELELGEQPQDSKEEELEQGEQPQASSEEEFEQGEQPQASKEEELEQCEQKQASSVEELEQGEQPQASREEELELGEQPQASIEELEKKEQLQTSYR